MTTLTQHAQQKRLHARAAFIEAAWTNESADRLAELADAAGLDLAAADAIIARVAETRADLEVAAPIALHRREAAKAEAHYAATRARVDAAIKKLETEADTAAFDVETTRKALREAESAAQRVLAVHDAGLLPAARLPKEVVALIERRKRERAAAEAHSVWVAANDERNRLRHHVAALEAELRDLPISIDQRQQEARIEAQLARAREVLAKAETTVADAERAFAKAKRA